MGEGPRFPDNHQGQINMRKILIIAGIVFLLILAYMLFWPTPISPMTWQAPADAGYSGAFASNDRLAGLQYLSLDGDEGPEHVVVRAEDGQDWVYIALGSGRIMRMHPDGRAREEVVRTGGRPLGFDFDATGALIIADPMWGDHGGLLRVTGRGASARIELLADRVDTPTSGDAINYIDAVVVAKNGRIYFTDASRRFLRGNGAAPLAPACSILSNTAPPDACWNTIRNRVRCAYC